MESNRLNIVREKSPRLVFKNQGNSFTTDTVINSKGQLDVDLEIIATALEMDENDNEVIRYTLRVIKTKEIHQKKTRA